MADIKISQLGAAVAVSGTDVLPMVNSSNPATTNKVTAATLKEYVIGDTDISAIGDGTPTGAISALKSEKVEGTAISENIETIGSTAIGDYVSGNTFLASNGNYYEATASITGGTTTLTVGTNCKLSTVDEQIGSLNEALTKQTLYFTNVACAATTGNFATVSDANISADHVVVECTFANPSAITTDVSWTTANGSLTLNGTCASATTVNITLSKKGN